MRVAAVPPASQVRWPSRLALWASARGLRARWRRVYFRWCFCNRITSPYRCFLVFYSAFHRQAFAPAASLGDCLPPAAAKKSPKSDPRAQDRLSPTRMLEEPASARGSSLKAQRAQSLATWHSGRRIVSANHLPAFFNVFDLLADLTSLSMEHHLRQR